jgi:membrane associated rhomboid family serine protease
VIFALPLYDDNPVRRAPLVNYFLIGLSVGAFLWELGQNQHQVLFSLGMIPAVLFGSAHLAPHLRLVPPWATVLTSMFLHGGWFHLVGNMLFLWIFGNNVEDTLGHGRYLFLYLASGIAAALVQAASSPASHVPMIGASGAIAGVLGAYLLLFPRANVHVFIWIVIFFGSSMYRPRSCSAFGSRCSW